MAEAQQLPSPCDSQFWRIRARLLKRDDPRPLAELAIDEAQRSLELAQLWQATNDDDSAEGERQRANRLQLVAELETGPPPIKARILRLRAAYLLENGQTASAAGLSAEADNVVINYLDGLSTEALKSHNAHNVLDFARISLAEAPTSHYAPRLKKLIASAERTIQNPANAPNNRITS